MYKPWGTATRTDCLHVRLPKLYKVWTILGLAYKLGVGANGGGGGAILFYLDAFRVLPWNMLDHVRRNLNIRGPWRLYPFYA